MKRIVILGSTGSIGTNTLDIISKFPEKFQAVGLTAANNVDKLEEQVRTFSPAVVAMADPSAAQRLRARCKGLKTTILNGTDGLMQAATLPEADLVISAIVGGAGLVPTLAAIKAGKFIALANKEPMVMNRGLEVVEAGWLFDTPASKIEVVVHRESIIHSLVEYADRSVIAQLGLPDMRTPIAYAMNYPERVPLDLPSLNLAQIGTLTFFNPDHDRFPCLTLGYDALRIGGTMPAAMNAANEVAVQAFLDRRIGFLGIAETIRRTMDAHKPVEVSTVEDALHTDAWARAKAGDVVNSLSAPAR